MERKAEETAVEDEVKLRGTPEGVLNVRAVEVAEILFVV